MLSQSSLSLLPPLLLRWEDIEAPDRDDALDVPLDDAKSEREILLRLRTCRSISIGGIDLLEEFIPSRPDEVKEDLEVWSPAGVK